MSTGDAVHVLHINIVERAPGALLSICKHLARIDRNQRRNLLGIQVPGAKNAISMQAYRDV